MSNKIHLSKFANGQETPLEMHRRIAWAGKGCDRCGGPPVVRCISYAPFKELDANCPEFLASIAMQNEGKVPMVEFTYGKFVRIGKSFACANCSKAMQHQAAAGTRKKSWILLDWDWGPEPKNPVSGQVTEKI